MTDMWVVQPMFDEGDDWPESYGTPDLIRAPTREAAEAAFPAERYTGLISIDAYTPEEWFARDGYPIEGLGRP
jgi:hypothetical protein